MEAKFANILNHNIESQVLLVPYPMQGHVNPMIKLSQRIASFGIKVTLVTTEHNYKGIVLNNDEGGYPVRLVAVPDGLESDDDRKDESKVAESVFKVMPGHVYNLIVEGEQHQGKGCQITCLIVDIMFGWAHDIAEKTGIKLAMFWTSSPGTLALTMKIPELIDNGTLNQEGTPLKKDDIQVLQDMPSMSITELPWYNPDKPTLQKTMFGYFSAVEQAAKGVRWLLCNWFHELSPSASVLIPNSVPIGPLLANGQPSTGTLKPEDSTCLTWLDQKPFRSVIYIAFGSISTLTQNQFDELASGLVLSGRSFIWVVRQGLIGDSIVRFPDGFEKEFAGYGKIVEWAPQDKVLAHPSIACFMTHCGWNSTVEGIINGVPLLCWPCFADQIHTRTCICDAWKVGISLIPDENSGIILRHEIKKKIDELLSCADLMENSLKLKEIAIRSVNEGRSFAAIQGFIEQIHC